jgi:putative phosphoesterase
MASKSEASIGVGVISDTHGLIRPEALTALQGSDLIIHAGDIGSSDLLPALNRIAPVHAIRGNVDRDAWTGEYPETLAVVVGEVAFWVLHHRNELDLDPAAADFAAVIFGHSHSPLIEWRQGVLYLNPGSAGPRRFKLPISVARVEVQGRAVRAELIELSV